MDLLTSGASVICTACLEQAADRAEATVVDHIFSSSAAKSFFIEFTETTTVLKIVMV